jgi:hypothetical protein
MNGALDCFQWKERESAGARRRGGDASGEYSGFVSLRNKVTRGHQRVRRDGGGRLGGEREHGAHRQCRN